MQDDALGRGLLDGDERASARLLFAAELARGHVTEEDLAHPEVARAVATRPVPPLPVRYAQRLAMKRGWRSDEDELLAPLVAARRAVLGVAAAAPPRFLVRVDEYPLAGNYRPGFQDRAAFERFHSILTEAGVPYLLAVNARVARDYLDPRGTESRALTERELDTLARLRADGVEFALHGFDHRTRHAHSRHHSELIGLSSNELHALIDRGLETLEPHGLRPDAFIPPFNRFAAAQFPVLAERFRIVCGGPETVPRMGLHRSPLVRGGTIYAPSYSPFYGRAGAIAAAAERMVQERPGVWIPLVLHWTWERDDAAGLERLAGVLAGRAHRWEELTEVVPEAGAAL